MKPNFVRKCARIFSLVITIGLDEYCLGERGSLGVTNAKREEEGQDLASFMPGSDYRNSA